MADDAALQQWSRMTYEERLWVLSQNYPDGIPQEERDRLIIDEVKRQFGALAVYLDHPELGPLLRRAASEGWTREQLQLELNKTEWWRTTTTAQREWDLLARSDPAETAKRIKDLQTKLRGIVDQQGLGDRYTDDQLGWMAGVFLAEGWTEDQMAKALFAQLDFQPGGKTPVGAAGLTMQQVKARAAQFGLPMSDEAAFDWARRVASGETTVEAVDVYLRDQAKSRYSWLAPDLDRGATIRGLFDPIIQQTAQLLEISPDMIDLTNPMYSRIIDYVDPNGTRRSMTAAEAAEYIRSTDAWLQTSNAKQGSAGLGEEIIKTFGKVA